MTQRAFSEDDLTLFLDGEAPDPLAKEIEAALSKDKDLAAYLDSMRSGQAQFVADQEALLSAAPALPDLPAPVRPPRAWAPALAGLAAGLVIATGVSWSLSTDEEPDWRAVVANYQSLYVTETLTGPAETQSARDAKLLELSGVLGIDLTDLPDVDGLLYRRAQQLGYQGHPLAQLTFLTAEGGPVALCILHQDAPGSAGIEASTLDGMAAYSWVDNGFGVLLIGPQGDSTLPEAATIFRAALKDAAA